MNQMTIKGFNSSLLSSDIEKGNFLIMMAEKGDSMVFDITFCVFHVRTLLELDAQFMIPKNAVVNFALLSTSGSNDNVEDIRLLFKHGVRSSEL